MPSLSLVRTRRRSCLASSLVFVSLLSLNCFAKRPASSEESCHLLSRAAKQVPLANGPITGHFECDLYQESRDAYIFALHYVGPEIEEGTSNLVGYFLVTKFQPRVFEWDFASEKIGLLRFPIKPKPRAVR